MSNILVVDDEPDIAELVKRTLEEGGYDVVTALNGDEALDQLGKGQVDLALVDFMMPEMTGRDLVEKIRADPNLRDLKLAFLTAASFGEEGKEELQRLGALDYIAKPFDNEDLIQRVKRMIGE